MDMQVYERIRGHVSSLGEANDERSGVSSARDNGTVSRGHSALQRGASAAVLATLVSLLAHLSAGGSLPHPLFLLAISVAAWMLCTALAACSRSGWLTLLAVALSQVLFHESFEWLRVPGWTTGTFTPHLHGPTIAPPVTGTSEFASQSFGHDMWVAHLLAAAVTAALLRHGEETIRLVHRPIWTVITSIHSCVPWTKPRHRQTATALSPVLRPGPLRGSLWRRGPPPAGVPTTSALRLVS